MATDLRAQWPFVCPVEDELQEAYIERLHPRNRLGRWVEALGRLHEITRIDVEAGRVPGIVHDPDVSPGISAHMRHPEHMTLGPTAYLPSGKVDTVLLAHEAGHRVGQHITAQAKDVSKIAELQAFRGEGETLTRGVGYMPTYDNPFGLSTRPEEILADAYSTLLHSGLRGDWDALPGEKVIAPGHDQPGEVQRVDWDTLRSEVHFPDGTVEKLDMRSLSPAEEPTSEDAKKRVALLRLVQKAARELGMPDKRLYRFNKNQEVERISESVWEPHLHPRDRRGRWREKLGLPRLVLKKGPGEAKRKLAEREVTGKVKQVADAMVDFYGGGGDPFEVEHAEEYLGTVGSDARYRHSGEVYPGLLFGHRAMRDLRDPEHGVNWQRVIAHEAAHSLSGVKPGPLPGFSQTVEEGGAEVLSLWFWKHRGQPFDERDATRVEGKWTEGLDSLVHHVQYREEVAEVVRRAASKVGWDRGAIIDEIETVFRGDHYARLDWRDSTEQIEPPPGVGSDAVGLIGWLLADE